MTTVSGEQSTPDSKPNFVLPRHNVITEANWEEMKVKGIRMLTEQVDLDTPEGQRVLKLWQDDYGSEYIYTGSAFEWDERRPLDHKPGSGIYVTLEGQQRFLEEGYASNRQSSPDTGSASS